MLITMTKQRYNKPIIKKIILVPKNNILAGSVVDNITSIESAGQEVIEFNDNDFSHNWEWE